MDYIGALERFQTIVHDGQYYIRLKDAKFLAEEILKDKEKEAITAKAVIPILQWTQEDDENLNHLIVLMNGLFEETPEGPDREAIFRLRDWLEDTQTALSKAGFRKEKEWYTNKNNN